MRLTHVLTRCAAVVRAAARRVGQLARTVVEVAARVIAPAARAVSRQVGRVGRVVLPVGLVACGHPEGAHPVPAATTAVSIVAQAAPASAAAVATTAPATATTTTIDEIELEPPAEPERPIGDFRMTFYYIAAEEEHAPAPVPPTTPAPLHADVPPAAANDNRPPDAGDADDEVSLAAAVGPALVPMLGRDCGVLAEVTPAFAASVRMQGTGRLRDGRLINVAGGCACGGTCFHIHRPGLKWGTGSSGLPLAPFRMVAVDPRVIPMGTLLYLPELDGRRMPGRAPHGGYVHDGCVVAADVGGGIKGKQLDLFVGRRAYYDGLARRGTSHGWATSVEVWDGSARCTRRGSKVSRSAAAAI
jgi:3D (Asp-Asp-Asp) domain-containing protein